MHAKLDLELHRLFLVPQKAGGTATLIDPQAHVRAMVLELTRPADWAVLGPVWQGVQAELDLPAPGIAVSGVDGLQLWFSLAEPVPVARARAFLEGLQQRFLADVDARRVRLWPAADATDPSSAPHHAARVPAQQASGDWSAFVAPDLAPVFGDTPWLDIPPSEEGQAHLLRALKPIPMADFDAALAALPAVGGGASSARTREPVAAADAVAPVPQAAAPATASVTAHEDAAQAARQFLRQVMQDESVALALRIEAAKVLLQSGR